MESPSGTTVTVGSVHELANILANMPPEQLQNVQLDPILYNALFQTIDTNPQVPDNQGGGNYETAANVEPPPVNQVKATDATADLFGMLQPPVAQMNEQCVVTMAASQQVNTVSTQSPSKLKIMKPSSSSGLQSQTHDVHLLSPGKSPSISITCNGLTSLQNLGPLQTKQTDLTQHEASRVKKVESQVNHDKNDTNQQDGSSGVLPGMLLGISCGQLSSTIVTPTTIMSQVIPTPAVQTARPVVNTTATSRYPQVVTLPSNAPFPSTTMSTGKVNGSLAKVTAADRNTASMHRVNREKVVDLKAHKAANNHATLDRKLNVIPSQVSVCVNPTNAVQSKTTSVNSSLYSSVPVTTPHERLGNRIAEPKGIVTSSHHEGCGERRSKLEAEGIVTAASHEMLAAHATLQLNDNVSIENAAIVLTNEQLAELMSGKSVEEVLQATQNATGQSQAAQNATRHSQADPVYVNSMDMFSGIPVMTSGECLDLQAQSIDAQIPPLREIQMIPKGRDNEESSEILRTTNVIKPKPMHGKIDTRSIPANKDNLLVSSKTLPVNQNTLPVNKNTLPVNKSTLSVNKNTLPVNKHTLAVNKEALPFDYKQIQGLKQTPDLGEVRKNLLSITPGKTSILRTPTSIHKETKSAFSSIHKETKSDFSSIHKETKSAFPSIHKETKSAFSTYNKSSTPNTHQYSDMQRTYSGTKQGDNQLHMRHHVAMGTTAVNQNIVSHNNNKNVLESQQGMVKNVWPINKGKNIYKMKNVNMSERERIMSQYQHVSVNQTHMVSPANVVKSGISSPAVNNGGYKTNINKDLKVIGQNPVRNSEAKSHLDKELKSISQNHVINRGAKSHADNAFENKAKYPEHEKNVDASGKATFNRSFKKISHCSGGESKKRIKKTLKEMEKTYPKEVSEILHIREAIKSSHVGDGENAMRKLAKLEIENQLKRFSQKVNMGRNAEFFSKERKLDIRRRKNIDPAKTNLDKSNPSNRSSKTEVLNESDLNKKETIEEDAKEHGRKRERPKKFDDFVLLSSKPKKEKKTKVRKFFFPEDFEGKHSQKTENNETEDDVKSKVDGDVAILEKDDKKSENIQSESVGKENIISDANVSGKVDVEMSEKKADVTAVVEKDLSTMFNKKSITPEVKIERLSLDKNKKDVEPKVPRAPRDLEERSFLDAISGDITPIIENRSREPFADVKEEDDDEEDEGEEDDDDEEEEKMLDEDHCTAKDIKEVLESLDVSENNDTTAIPKTTTTTNNKSKKKKRKKKSTVMFEPEVLPQHLKRKTKIIRVEETVIDLSRVQMKSAYTESSFDLNDSIEHETSQLLRRKDWACTFCGKPGNIGTLDVLFGPYKVSISNHIDNTNKTTTTTAFSTWVHRDCAIWTSTIYLNNQKLCGLGEALTSAAKMTCQLCSKVGATLECSFRQCRDNYHFVCAKQRGCSFNIDNFTVTCPKHR